MAKVKMGVSALHATGLVAKSQGLHDNIAANAATFPAPEPTMVVFQEHIDTLAQANADAEVNGGKAAFDAKRAGVKQVRVDIRSLAAYVQLVSGGDEAVIKQSGFEVVERGTPFGELDPPALLRYRLTNTSGRVSLVWAPQPGADMHHVFMSTSNNPFNWELVGTSAKARFNANGLTPGTIYWFAVTAIGAAGESSKSEPCQAMAAL